MIFFGQKNFEDQQHQTSNELAEFNPHALNQHHKTNTHNQKQAKQQVAQDSEDKRKLLDVLGKVLVILSIMIVIIGIALLVFGIIRNMIFLYVPGSVLILIAIIGFIASCFLLYLGSRKNKKISHGNHARGSERKNNGFNNLTESVGRRITRV
jgi:hypothetical protein